MRHEQRSQSLRYYIYCRKSTEEEDRQILSLGDQERELVEYAKAQNLEIVEVVKESKSARVPDKRVLFRSMVDNLISDKPKADGVIVWQLNRLARNTKEGGELQYYLSCGKVKEIVTPDRTWTTENISELELAVHFGMSAQFSSDLSKNVKRGQRGKVMRGEYRTTSPTFYKHTFDPVTKMKNIEPDPETSHYYEQLVDMVIKENKSPKELAEWLNERGVKTRTGSIFHRSTMLRILYNPSYCGYQRYNSEKYKGTWKPLISEEKWNILQRKLGNKSRPKNYSHAKGYRGLFICATCGCSITCSHKIKNGKSYFYYHCTKKRGRCDEPALTEKDLEDQIYDQLRKIKFTDLEQSEMAKKIKTMYKAEFKDYDLKQKKHVSKVNGVVKRMDQLLDMRLKEQIEQEVFEAKNSELKAEHNRLMNLYQDSGANLRLLMDGIDGFLQHYGDLSYAFDNGTIEERAALVETVGWNLSIQHKQVRWNFRKPYSLMLLRENFKERPVASYAWVEVGNYFKTLSIEKLQWFASLKKIIPSNNLNLN